MEAAIDPLLCHYQDPVGSILCQDNIYSPDPSEILTGLSLVYILNGKSGIRKQFQEYSSSAFIIYRLCHFFFLSSGCSMDQKQACIESYNGSPTKKKRDYFLSEHFDLCSSSVLTQFPNPTLHHSLYSQHSDNRASVEEGDAGDYGRAQGSLSPSNTFMGKS